MNQQKYRIGATGVRLKSAIYEDGEIVDVTTASSVKLVLVSPSGVESAQLTGGAFTEDNLHKCYYDIESAALITERGTWCGYWILAFSGGYSGPTSRFEFDAE